MGDFLKKIKKYLLFIALFLIWFKNIFISNYSIITISIGVLFCVWGLSTLNLKRKKFSLSRNNFIIILLITTFIVYNLISFLLTNNFSFGYRLTNFKQLLLAIIFFFLIFNNINSKKIFKLSYKFFTIGGILSGLILIFGYYTNNVFLSGKGTSLSDGTIRFTGLISNDANYAASYLLIVIPLAFFLGKEATNNKKKLFYYLGCITTVVSIFLTYSRAAYLSLILLFFILILNIEDKFKSIIILCFSGLIIISFAPSSFFIRLSSFYNLLKDIIFNQADFLLLKNKAPSLFLRYQLMKSGVFMFLSNFVFGVGFGNFQLFSKKYGALSNQVAHNSYLNIAGELGFVGLFIISLIIISIGEISRFTLKITKDDSMILLTKGLRISFLVYLFNSLFLNNIQEIMFWVLIALLMSTFEIPFLKKNK